VSELIFVIIEFIVLNCIFIEMRAFLFITQESACLPNNTVSS